MHCHIQFYLRVHSLPLPVHFFHLLISVAFHSLSFFIFVFHVITTNSLFPLAQDFSDRNKFSFLEDEDPEVHQDSDQEQGGEVESQAS